MSHINLSVVNTPEGWAIALLHGPSVVYIPANETAYQLADAISNTVRDIQAKEAQDAAARAQAEAEAAQAEEGAEAPSEETPSEETPSEESTEPAE